MIFMADKKKEKKVEKKEKTTKVVKKPTINVKKEPKYSLAELCSLLSVSKYEGKAKFLIHGLNENDKISLNKFRSFFKK